jgi:hypothetical protein
MSTIDPTTGPETGPPSHGAEHALIYVPGLQLVKVDDKSLAGVIARLQAACDHFSDSREPTWSARWGERTEPRRVPPAARIMRHSPGDGREEPVLDVFHYDWTEKVTSGGSSDSRSRKLLRLGFVLAGAPSFLRFFYRARSTPRGRLQLGIALAAVLLAGLYTIVLFGAVAATTWEALGPEPGRVAPAEPTGAAAVPAAADVTEEAPGEVRGIVGEDDPPSGGSFGVARSIGDWWTLGRLQAVALGGALAARLFGATWVKARLSAAGEGLVVARNYLRLAEHRPTVTRGLADLVESLTEQGYRDVTICAYSFGAIIAVDTLFPAGHAPEKGLGGVRGLVTIGMPLDFAEATRPDWLSGRRYRPGSPTLWHNIYGIVDLLGAEVTVPDDWTPAGVEGTPRPEPTNHAYEMGVAVTTTNLLELYGFASHGMYWGSDLVEDRNVFDHVIHELYSGTPVLS